MDVASIGSKCNEILGIVGPCVDNPDLLLGEGDKQAIIAKVDELKAIVGSNPLVVG